MENFNKQEFAELTKKAMANNLPSVFAKSLQINQKYLEAILKGMPQSPPKLGVIDKIAKESQGEVTCEELSIAAGYMQPSPHPEIKKLTERIGKWETMFGRQVNLEAFRQYLKAMKGGMTAQEYGDKAVIHRNSVFTWLSNKPTSLPTEQTAEMLCAMSENPDIDFADFMKAAGYPKHRFCIQLKSSLKPDKILLPEGMVDKKSGATGEEHTPMPESLTDTEKREPACPGKEQSLNLEAQDVTELDLMELAIMRFLRNKGPFVFMVSEKGMLAVVMMDKDGRRVETIKFHLGFFGRECTYEDVVKFYGTCAMMGVHDRIYLVMTDREACTIFRTYCPVNLTVKPKILFISGVTVTGEEEI